MRDIKTSPGGGFTGETTSPGKTISSLAISGWEGKAADIECPGTGNRHVAEWISDNCTFDQIILEFHNPEIPDSGWVHVSYNRGANRMQRLRAIKEDGKTVYKPGLVE